MMIDSSPPTETMRHADDNNTPTRTTTTTKRDKFKSKRPRPTPFNEKTKEEIASLEEILQFLQEGMNIQVGRVTLSLNEALVGHQPVMIIQVPTKELLLSEDSQENKNDCVLGHETSDQQLPFYRITVFVVSSSSSPGYTDALQQDVLEFLTIVAKSRTRDLNNRFQSMNHSNRCHTLSYSDSSQGQRFKLVVGRRLQDDINSSSEYEYLFQIHWDKQFLFQGSDTKYWYQFVEQSFQLALPTPSEKTNDEFVFSNLRLDNARCAALAESFHGMKLKFVDCIIENDQAFSKCSYPLHFSGCILNGDAVELAQAIGRDQGPTEITFDHTFFDIPAFCKALRSTKTLNVFQCLNYFDELVDHDRVEVEECFLNVDELLSSLHEFSASLDTFTLEGALSDEALNDQSTLKTALSNSTIPHQTLKIYKTDGSPIEWEAFDKMQDLLEHNFIAQSLELNLQGCHHALQAQSTIKRICMCNRYLKNAHQSSTLIGQTRNTAILGAAISHGRIRSSKNHEALWALIRGNTDLLTMQRLELKLQSNGNKMEAG